MFTSKFISDPESVLQDYDTLLACTTCDEPITDLTLNMAMKTKDGLICWECQNIYYADCFFQGHPDHLRPSGTNGLTGDLPF